MSGHALSMPRRLLPTIDESIVLIIVKLVRSNVVPLVLGVRWVFLGVIQLSCVFGIILIIEVVLMNIVLH
jgi:hypothetical protein